MMAMRTIVLDCDEQDYAVIQREIARRQLQRDGQGMYSIPDGESNIAGAVFAECIRDLDEYRSLFGERPAEGE